MKLYLLLGLHQGSKPCFKLQLPLLASKEDIQQQSGTVDLNGSTDYDYNQFFLDLLNNEELKQIADLQDKRTFIKYISDEFQAAFPNYQDEFSDIGIQRVCTRDWCTSTYALFVVVAAVVVNVTILSFSFTRECHLVTNITIC